MQTNICLEAGEAPPRVPVRGTINVSPQAFMKHGAWVTQGISQAPPWKDAWLADKCFLTPAPQ